VTAVGNSVNNKPNPGNEEKAMTTVELPTAKYDTINVPAFWNWILELESGETQQGKSRLHTIDENGTESLCCLGVLSRQLAPTLNLPVERFEALVTYDDRSGLPGDNVFEYLGIPDTHIEWLDTGYTVLVTIDIATAQKLNNISAIWNYNGGERVGVQSLNDRGLSFVEIAALLKKEFLNA
jgi:hypothetical protein